MVSKKIFSCPQLLNGRGSTSKIWLGLCLSCVLLGTLSLLTKGFLFIQDITSSATTTAKTCTGKSHHQALVAEEVNGSLLEIPPVTIAPAELHRYADLNYSFYMFSAYHEPRFFPYRGADPEHRIILLLLADEFMRSTWLGWNVEVWDGWGCLLCSFSSEINPKAADYQGPEPQLVFKRPNVDPLNCWWSVAANRSYQWNDLHETNYNLGQFECSAPEGLPLDKISLSTLAHHDWAQGNNLEAVLFAPLETEYAGFQKVAVPSFERFKPVQHMKYVDRVEDAGIKPNKERVASNLKRPRISLCVGPLYMSGAPFIEEWIAYTQLMGVDHYHVFYWNHPLMETAPHFLKKLQYFQMKGIMTVYHVDMEFQDPTINKTTGLEARPKAQATLTMDCYYRAAGKADFVGWMDMDEFLAPTNVTQSNWFDALEPLTKDPTLGTMVFAHWWYKIEDRIQSARNSFVHTELVTASTHSRDIAPLGYTGSDRTKCLARVGSVRMQAIHVPIDSTPGYRFENVSADIMFFRHYRGKGFLQSNLTSQDSSLLRIQDKLHAVVKEMKKDMVEWGINTSDS